MPTEVKRHRFTVEEYHEMGRAGVLSEDDRVELIDGEIVEMAPIGTRHLTCVIALTHLTMRAAASGFFVSVQNPVTLDDGTEPQPDLSLLKRRLDPAGKMPGPDDVALLVEVSDTTLAYDKNVKLPRYARAGIPEVWIVDLAARKVEVHSDPSPEGYRATHDYGPGENVRSRSIKDLASPVDEILG